MLVATSEVEKAKGFHVFLRMARHHSLDARPSLLLGGADLIRREFETFQAFKACSLPVLPVIYSSPKAVVSDDIGSTIMGYVDAIKDRETGKA